MKKIGIFFGSDTGNTENVAEIIHRKLGKNISDIFDIARSNKKKIERYDKLILGIPTWYYGEMQCDWENFSPILKKIDFTGKLVAIFGCGDQEDYSEYFCDALNSIYIITKKQGAKFVGNWPIETYNFESSKSLINDTHFVGLAIDEDRQPNLTFKRINSWVEQIYDEMNFIS
ncbi:Flavodoxin-1 [Candidatus Westeberhardia cardiocondylae]|uniref:Flavodoxin n=1 Tax=Candidatus Westeberhardia cardiocondylae TaxID=1594731 RepID=A0A0H5BWV0_9ENTR|nr:flavodoxin FldA [Candidatus Westeberhardia cardiocondylae]CEN32187.1 Flavodoxin-1 [Candidatus Westeberhardia cardiocondylae]